MEDGRNRSGRIAVKRPPTSEHLVEHGTQRPDVGADVEIAAAQLLRRHVGQRANRGGRVGRRRQAIGQTRYPEVDDLHDATGREQRVGRLDIAVDDAGAMRLGQAIGHLGGNLHGFVDCQGTRGDPLLQRRTVVARHDQHQAPVVALLDRVHGRDVGMVERGDRLGLAEEAGSRVGAIGGLGRHELQGDGTAEAAVARSVHDTHAAAADAVQHFVV